jgi:hypothetical protein
MIGSLYCARMVPEVTRSVSEVGTARPRSRFELLDWDR